MITLTLILVSVILFAGVVSFGLRMAWSLTRFVFGLGLFWFCPLLFVLAVVLGGFRNIWLLIVIVGLLCGRGFFNK